MSTTHPNATHGMTDSPEYRSWCSMKARCCNSQNPSYPRYGGRGIKVCQRWLDSFSDFLADMGKKPTPKHTIDRFPDNNGNYEPGNCRWATAQEQSRNRRSNRVIEFGGVSRTVAEWADVLGVGYFTLARRIERKGYEVALSLPKPPDAKRGQGRRLGSDSHRATITESDVLTIRWRVANGEKLKAVAADYGLSESGVWRIVHRLTWRHVA